MSNRPTAEQRARIALVREVCAFGEYFGKHNDYDHKLFEHPKDKEGSRLSIGGYSCRGESLLQFDRSGTVWYSTWETSCHNGDPYNHKEEILDHDEAMKRLTGLRNMLQERAVQLEVKLLEERRRHELERVARTNIRASVLGELPKRSKK